MYNICEVGSGSDVYCYEALETSGAILSQYEQDHDGDAAGNKIRKGFEAVMYEYAKIIQIDQLEESHHLISRLVEEHKPVFVKKASKKNYLWSSELVDEILAILGEPKTDTDKVTDIRKHIADYQRDTDVQKVVELLK